MSYLNGPIPIQLNSNPYNRVQWQDEIRDPITGEIKEEGTIFWADFANNMEWGIWNSFEFINSLSATIRRLQVQMELDGRVPGNAGTFADTLDGSTNKITLDKTLTDIKENIVAGTTVLPVANVAGFVPFSEVTIFDDESYEDTFITEVGTDTITVQTLENDYKKGAKIARSIVFIDELQKQMGIANWQSYDVQLVEVI